MALRPSQERKFYTIACWVQGKKKFHCEVERTGSFDMSILDNGFIFNLCWQRAGPPIRTSSSNEVKVLSHRGQEAFNVSLMGFINSVPYVQRQIENAIERLDRVFVPPAKSSVIVWISSSPLNHLFVYENGWQICGGPGTRTFDTMEGQDDVLGHLLGTLIAQMVH